MVKWHHSMYIVIQNFLQQTATVYMFTVILEGDLEHSSYNRVNLISVNTFDSNQSGCVHSGWNLHFWPVDFSRSICETA